MREQKRRDKVLDSPYSWWLFSIGRALPYPLMRAPSDAGSVQTVWEFPVSCLVASPARLLEAFQRRHASPAASPPQLPAAPPGRLELPPELRGRRTPPARFRWSSRLCRPEVVCRFELSLLGLSFQSPARCWPRRPMVVQQNPTHRGRPPVTVPSTSRLTESAPATGSVPALPCSFCLPLGYQVLPRLARRRHLSSRHPRLRHRRLQPRSRYIRPPQNTSLPLRQAAINHTVLLYLPGLGRCG